jgi:TPP-dependent pyruvate/acetoin dehydrogenase alpha subunit
VEAVFEAARAASERARRGEGPTLIEAHTMRMHGHGAHDDMSYVPDELLQEWRGRDPIERYVERLTTDHRFPEQEIDEVRREVDDQVEEGARKALDSPMPDPELGTAGVYADAWEPLGDGQAPWSYWRHGGAGADGSGNGSVRKVAA